MQENILFHKTIYEFGVFFIFLYILNKIIYIKNVKIFLLRIYLSKIELVEHTES